MSDKMTDLFPGEVIFSDGEQPSATKLTGWGQQTKDALATLGLAMGNVWNADSSLAAKAEDMHPLLFTNIARFLGNQELLNPSHIYGQTFPAHTQTLPVGETEVDLDYWVDVQSPYTNQELLTAMSVTPPAGSVLDTSIDLTLEHTKLLPSELLVPGDWTVMGRTLYTFSPTSGGVATYNGTWLMEDIAISFSCIPHLAQVALPTGTGLSVQIIDADNETYYILTTPNLTHDYDGEPKDGSWGNLQIPLPKIARYGAGEEIPEGLITLWDLGSPVNVLTAQKIENAIFYGNGDNYSVVAKNCVLEANDRRYVMVCAAEGLAWAVRQLRDLFYEIIAGNVVHDTHSYLKKLRFNAQDVNGDPITGFHVFGRSRVARNDHTMYLHREGFDPLDPGIYCNAMLGDLMMASIDPTDGYLNLLSHSRQIRFGSMSGPAIYYNNTLEALVAENLYGLYQSKISENDLHGDYLLSKLHAGVGIRLTQISDGIDKIQIDSTVASEGRIKLDVDDTLGYFLSKILPGTNVTFTTGVDENGERTIAINAGAVGDPGGGTGYWPGTATWSAPGTYEWVVPEGVTSVYIDAQGSGGGGAGGNEYDESFPTGFGGGGGGGGAGEHNTGTATVIPGAHLSVVIAAGGAGGGVNKYTSNAPGGNGGYTHFDSYLGANGGGGGGAPNGENGGNGGSIGGGNGQNSISFAGGTYGIHGGAGGSGGSGSGAGNGGAGGTGQSVSYVFNGDGTPTWTPATIGNAGGSGKITIQW